MSSAIRSAWALLVGMALIMLGNGLQGSLLGLRATIEGFPTLVTGIVMSCYYLGFLAGSMRTPTIVARVGHIRVFAAVASIASAAVLLHALIPEPFAWGVMRFITGFCFASIYVTAESWLNQAADNRNRGQILGIYMAVSYLGMAGGQLLLNLDGPENFTLFILVSVLVSLAVVPMLLGSSSGPVIETPKPVSLRELYRMSPLGVVAMAGAGATQGTLFGVGAVWGAESGFTVAEISLFLTAMVLGGVVLQWPVGRLSDRIDRRRVIAVTALGAAIVSLGMTLLTIGDMAPWHPWITMFALGGLALPLYSLAIAHTNDFVEPGQVMGASAGLVLVNGAGASLAPFLATLLMSVTGTNGFLWFLGGLFTVVGLFSIWRMTRRPTVPRDEQAPWAAMPARASTIAPSAIADNAAETGEQAREEAGGS